VGFEANVLKRILYIDLLFPHHFHGTCKNVFNKGKPGELNKMNQIYQMETAKLRMITYAQFVIGSKFVYARLTVST
jgi:hypothetical protein